MTDEDSLGASRCVPKWLGKDKPIPSELQPFQEIFDRLGLHSDTRFSRMRADMRCQYDLLHGRKGTDIRFSLKDIESGSSDRAPLEGSDQRGFIHHVTPRHVDKEEAAFGMGQDLFIDETFRSIA